MQAAKGKGDPPPLLWKKWRCRDWGIPPKMAGIDDQDYAEIHAMDTLETIYEAIRAWRHAAQHPLDERERSVINWLVKAGVM